MSFDLPWVNQDVLNATKRLQRLTPSTPWIPGMPAPAAPFVPETAPAFGDYGPWIPGMPAPTPPPPPVLPTPTRPTIPVPSARNAIAVPTPKVQGTSGVPTNVVPGMTDEEWLEQVGPTFADADPLGQQALLSGGFMETPSEAIERQNVEREIHQFQQRLSRDSNFAELYHENMEREAAGLDPRPMDGLEALVQYDKDILDPLAYAIVYGVQKLSPGLVWQGYSKGEGYEFEKRVDEIQRTALPYEEARALELPITGTFEGAIRQAAEEELLPWYVTEPIKLIADPPNWPVGGVPLIRGAAKFPFVVGAGVVRLKNAGSAVGRNVPLHYAGVAEAAGDPARAFKRRQMEASRAFFDVPEFDYTLTGNGRIEIVYPEATVIRANSSAEELFRILPLSSGLTGRQRLMSQFKESGAGKLMRKGLGGLDWIMTPENHYVTPAMEARNVGLRNLRARSLVSPITHLTSTRVQEKSVT